MKVAIVLAAGNGTRLKPYTEFIPKPMLPVKGKPIVRHIYERLAKHGFKVVVVCQGQHKLSFQHEFRDTDATIIPVSGGKGTLRDLREATNHKKFPYNSEYLVHYGDELTDVDYSKLHEKHTYGSSPITLALIPKHQLSVGVIETDPQGFVTDFTEKPEVPIKTWCGIGMFTVTSLLDMTQPMSDVAKDLIPLYVKQGRVASVEFDSEWMDLGHVKAYEKANR